MADGPRFPEHGNFLTLQQAADLLTVDYETARRWIVLKGAIPYVRVGPDASDGRGEIRVSRRDVERLIIAQPAQ